MKVLEIDDLKKAARAIYIACPEEVARDISEKLLWAVNEIEKLRANKPKPITGEMLWNMYKIPLHQFKTQKYDKEEFWLFEKLAEKINAHFLGGRVMPANDSIGPYEKLGLEIGKLVDEKQIAYGDSFGESGKILMVLYPNGITVDQYDDILAMVRVIDKLFRIANRKDAFGESPWKDITGYGLLATAREENNNAKA